MKKVRGYALAGLLLCAVTVLGLFVCAGAEETHIHDGKTFIAWESENSLPDQEGYYYLTKNVTLGAYWEVPSGTVSLCLNGKTVTKSEDESVIVIQSGCTLNLYDETGDSGIITHETGKNGRGVYIFEGGTFNLSGGTIRGSKLKENGGGVCNKGTFTMTGGIISENEATGGHSGGGVYNAGSFTMIGGIIRDNEANYGGV